MLKVSFFAKVSQGLTDRRFVRFPGTKHQVSICLLESDYQQFLQVTFHKYHTHFTGYLQLDEYGFLESLKCRISESDLIGFNWV